MSVHRQPLLPGNIYHIYNRAVGSEKSFPLEDNYKFFLSKIRKYIIPIGDIYCWALLPNHFHFLIKIKDSPALESHYKTLGKASPFLEENAEQFITQCFSNALNSYAKAFNKLYKRKGALFIDSLKRVVINTEGQFGATAFYIHKNPVHHGYCTKMQDWKWSSYSAFLNKAPSQPATIELLDWFGGKKEFIRYHSQPVYLKNSVVLEND